jgi:outer membrane protein assembly factor BamB
MIRKQGLRFNRASSKSIELLFVGLSVTLAGCGSNTTNKAKLPKGAELDAGPGATDSGALDAGPPLVTLAGPAEFNGANGIRFDGKGKLYVGSVANGKLYRIDPDTGETLTTLDLWIDPATSLLSAMRMTFANGDTKTMTLARVVTNPALGSDAFSVER